MILLDQTAPLFSNDLVGFIKIIAIIVGTVSIPIGSVIIVFLKKAENDRVAQIETSLLAKVAQLKSDLDGVGGRVGQNEKEVAEVRVEVRALTSQIAESQRDILTALQASSEAQLRASSDIKVDVARLQERNDLGRCVSEFGKSIERLVEKLDERNT